MFSNKRVVMKLLFLLILMITSFVGCGDLMKNKVVKKEMESQRFRIDCELNVNAFTDILEKNISSDIRCLEDNLNLFIKVVKSDRPGYLSRIALEQFVKKNRPDIKPEMVKALKAIFDINYLITGEDPEFISAESIEKLIDFAILFNQKSSLHYKNTFGNTRQTPWDIFSFQRGIIQDTTREIVVGLRKVFKEDRDGQVHKLNMLDILDQFATDENYQQIENAKKVLFVKQVLLGGNRDEITHLELQRLLLNLQPLMTVIHDAIRYKYVTIGQANLLSMLKGDVEDLEDILSHRSLGNRDITVLFTIDEVIDAAKVFIEDFEPEKMMTLITEGKKLIMGGNESEVKGREVKNLFAHANTILKSGLAFHDFYRDFRIVMESPLPVTLNFSEYRHNYPQYQKELFNFERIVKRYRYFKGEFESAYFVSGIKRNADAIFEIYLLEYASKLLLSTFGSPSPNSDNYFSYSIDQFQVRALFKKFQKDLVALDLISSLTPMVAADNISLLGTLFQNQSDNNKVVDVNELAELGVNLLGSFGMTDHVFKYFEEKNCSFDEFGRVEPDCVKKLLFPAMCSKYRTYYPLFFSSIGTPKKCEEIPENEYNTAYLDRSIRAARTCMNYTDGDKEEIWYSKGDLTNIIVALQHSEATVLRWDANQNNILEPSEVDKAYSIYSTALDGFLDTKSAIIRKFKKQIYQYLIKYEEVPDEKNFKSTLKFIKFLMSFKKESYATRKTISSVLMAIGLENAKLPNSPQIDCNYLRNPDRIPSQIEELSTPVDNRPDYSHLLGGYLNRIE
jgi:hypothetical protein